MNPTVALDSAYTTYGVDHVSFWNGRVLTAEDLRDEQAANAHSRARLGRAVGAGIGAGLVVSRVSATQVQVTKGSAIAPDGQALEVPTDVTVSLTVPAGANPGDGVFVVCENLPSATPTGTGLYLLVLKPGSADKEEAAGVPYNGNGIANVCGPRYTVEGVSFRLVAVDAAGLAPGGAHDSHDVDILGGVGGGDLARNVQAHVFLDSAARRATVQDPFGAGARASTIDRLRAIAGKLEDCEAPLALVSWESSGIAHVDGWPVRRSTAATPAKGEVLAHLAGPGRLEVGMAAYLQFRDHLDDLVAAGGELRAVDHFRYLPPAGLLPLAGSDGDAGVDLGAFFTDVEVRSGEPLPAARVGPILHASLAFAPVDILPVDATDPAAPEVLWSYVIDDLDGTGQPYVLFATEHLRYLAVVEEEDPHRVVITGVLPAGDHQPGSEITVSGLNFIPTFDGNTVSVGGSPVPVFNHITDTELVFNVPDMPGLPRAAAIVVENENGVAEWLISVVERVVIPDGEITFTEDFAEVDGQVITEGDTFEFAWLVESITDIAETYTIEPLFTSAVGATNAAWLATARVLDDAGTARSTFEIIPFHPDVPGSGSVRIKVEVTVPAGAESVHLSLKATSHNAPDDPNLNRSSSPSVITVGDEPEVSDGRVTFEPPDIFAVTPAVAQVRIDAKFAEAGTFAFAAVMEPDAPGVWAIIGVQPVGNVPKTQGSEQEVVVLVEALAADTAPERFLKIVVTGTPATGATYTSFQRIATSDLPNS